jgi:hypothetical protein
LVRLKNRPAALIVPGFVQSPLSAHTDTYCKWKLHQTGDCSPSKHPAIQSELQASFDAR